MIKKLFLWRWMKKVHQILTTSINQSLNIYEKTKYDNKEKNAFELLTDITFITSRTNIKTKQKYDNDINNTILTGKKLTFTKKMNVITVAYDKNIFLIYKEDFVSEMNYINNVIVTNDNYINKSFADELKTNWVITINDIPFKFISVKDDDADDPGGYYEFTTHTPHNLKKQSYDISFYTSRNVNKTKEEYLQVSGTKIFTKKMYISNYSKNPYVHIAIHRNEISRELSIFIDISF